MSTIDEITKQISLLQQNKVEIEEKETKLKNMLYDMMRPVYVLNGTVKRYSKKYDKCVGCFSSFAQAYEAKKIITNVDHVHILAITKEEFEN